MRQYIAIYLLSMLLSLSLFAEETIEEPQPTVETIELIEQETTIEAEDILETTKENKIPKETPTPSITTLVEEIKTAKAEDKRELMNQLKIKLRAMNQEKRQETMRELKQSFAKNAQGEHKHQNRQQEHSRHQPQFRQLQRGGQGHGGGHK